jgi:hypothetical protein
MTGAATTPIRMAMNALLWWEPFDQSRLTEVDRVPLRRIIGLRHLLTS